jgi:hypothetical protein
LLPQSQLQHFRAFFIPAGRFDCLQRDGQFMNELLAFVDDRFAALLFPLGDLLLCMPRRDMQAFTGTHAELIAPATARSPFPRFRWEVC